MNAQALVFLMRTSTITDSCGNDVICSRLDSPRFVMLLNADGIGPQIENQGENQNV